MKDPDLSITREAIVTRALQTGFDVVGFTEPNQILEAGERLKRFLELGRHGDMGWLMEKADRRYHPQALWPETQTVIVLGLDYTPPRNPLTRIRQGDRAAISVYAQNLDYHDVMKRRLKALGRWIGETYKTELKVFVDTAPVLEKPLAQAAGLGWQGKHTNLVSRQFGSWLFLGAIYLAYEFPVDKPETDHCGQCRNCLDICPTAAFPAPYQLDARRCISYLTIEHASPIPRGFRRAIGNRIYGCDDCLAICPWNKFASRSNESAFWPRAELDLPLLSDLAKLDEAGFRTFFRQSPIKRIGRDRFLRNVAISLGNSGDRAALPALHHLKEDPANLIRGAAIWGLAQILPRAEFIKLRDQALKVEGDISVQEEWRAG